ncbi:renin receptor-like [Clavelina lepadiformis]|uniref:Renin receptor n=1 Tax=Clavelina lepadiformis TaxID=159417 RepID=A0ABP0GJC4_CLALP
MIMKEVSFIIFIAGLFSKGLAELCFLSVPSNIELLQTSNQIQLSDVTGVLDYLMGFSTQTNSHWKGVKKMDVFNRPQANLFINLLADDDMHIGLDECVVKYNTKNMDISEIFSENIIFHIGSKYDKKKPTIVRLLSDGELLRTLVSDNTAGTDESKTVTQMRQRLQESNSVASNWTSAYCLDIERTTEAFFFGELQAMLDIVNYLEINPEAVFDSVPDFFYFSLTGLHKLAKVYGVKSCQVDTAIRVLEKVLPNVVASFNNLYKGMLLAEAHIYSNPRSFDEIHSRHTRSINVHTDIKGLVMPKSKDYPVIANMIFWFMVVFVLATLAASYAIWFMDPGRDSIIYRMTTQRMKID